MKLTTTTSSFLLASMALSPSMVSAAPTGMEAPTSPNPAGSPSIRQFPTSPRFAHNQDAVQFSSNAKRAPAHRTGPGSPRKSLPAHMHKVDKRDGPLDAILGLLDPVTGMLKPELAPLAGTLAPLFDILGGLPIAGPVVKKVGTGLGLMNSDTADQASSHAGAQSLPLDPQQILAGIPGLGGISSGLGLFPPSAGHQSSGLPLDGLGDIFGSIGGLTGSLPIPAPIRGVVGKIVGVTNDGHVVVQDATGTFQAKFIALTGDKQHIIVENARGVLLQLPIPRSSEADAAEGVFSAESAPAANPASPHVTPPTPPASVPSPPVSAPSPPASGSPPEHPLSAPSAPVHPPSAPSPPVHPPSAPVSAPSSPVHPPSDPISHPSPPASLPAAAAAAIPSKMSTPPLFSPIVAQDAPDNNSKPGLNDVGNSARGASTSTSTSVGTSSTEA